MKIKFILKESEEVKISSFQLLQKIIKAVGESDHSEALEYIKNAVRQEGGNDRATEHLLRLIERYQQN